MTKVWLQPYNQVVNSIIGIYFVLGKFSTCQKECKPLEQCIAKY